MFHNVLVEIFPVDIAGTVASITESELSALSEELLTALLC